MQKIIYTIHQNNKLFTVSTVGNPVILASYDSKRLDKLIKILKTHKEITNKWLNKSRMFSKNTIHLIENDVSYEKEENDLIYEKEEFKNYCLLNEELNSIYEESNNSNEIDIGYFNMDEHDGLTCIGNMYNVHNIKIFIVKDIEYNETIPLLSIQGLIMDKGPIELDREKLDINIRLYFDNLINKS